MDADHNVKQFLYISGRPNSLGAPLFWPAEMQLPACVHRVGKDILQNVAFSPQREKKLPCPSGICLRDSTILN